LHSDRNFVLASRHTRLFSALSSGALLLAGCGSAYRPVVSSINLVGPAGQPQKFIVAISSTGATTPGLVNFIDFSGDTVLDTAALGAAPYYLALSAGGGEAYTLNGDGTVNSFGVSQSLIQSQVNQTTLPAGSAPTSIVSQGTNLYISQTGLNETAQFTGVPPQIQQELPTGPGTVYTVAVTSAPRAYAVVQGSSSVAPHVSAIETSTNTVSNSIAVGANPVYGVMTPDARRAFIMNKGSNTVTVINAQSNALDTFSTHAGGTIPVGIAPVWADFNPLSNQMLVLNQGDATHPGSVTVISIPLCTASTVTSNPNCDVLNPVDSTLFGTVVATIPVGINPAVIAVIQDGTQAFVANQGNAAAGINGSISIINLTTDTVIATIPAASLGVNSADSVVHGHPTFVAVTSGLPTGKAYITSSDSQDMTVIKTDTDTVATHISLQGLGGQVRVNLP
jgi:DNA-binding beta-propeller fold protein YncE